MSSLPERLRALLRRPAWSRRQPDAWAGPDAAPGPQVGLLIWAGVVGAVGAVLASLLRAGEDRFARLLWQGEGGMAALVGGAPVLSRLALPVLGGAVAGLVLVYGVRVTRAATGWDILEAVVLRDGVLKFRPALVKSLSSLLTIVTGGSVGREGPMVLLASTAASKVGQWLSLPTRQLRILTAAGVASGIASAYNAPVAASLFAMEIILGNFAMDVFAPLVCASVTATLVSRGLYGSDPVFSVPPFDMISAWELVGYLVLGLAGGLLAAAFMGSLRASARLFSALRLPRPLSMAAVGLVLGVTVLQYPEIVGGGRHLTDALLDASYAWRLAAILLLIKLVLTGLTVGSGAVGGVFTPSLFVGAALGYGLGTLAGLVAPAHTSDPAAYALVGMGALLAGTTHAPIMAVLMIFEMSLDTRIFLPLMLSCAAASLVARTVTPASIYTEALRRKGASLATPEAQVMTSLQVKDIMRRDFDSVPPDMLLPQVLDRFLEGRRNHLYVVDGEGRFLGAIGLHDLKEALQERAEVSFIIAVDLMRPRFEITTPEERLDKVMERLWAQDCERIPVLSDRDGGKIMGTVSKRDILGVYTLEVLQRRSMMTKFQAGGARDESTYVELPADHRVDGVLVGQALAGQALSEARLRERFGVTVLMVRRRGRGGDEIRLVPEPGTVLEDGDRLVVFGPDDGVARLRSL